MKITHKDYQKNKSHETKTLLLNHCGGFNTELSDFVDWKEYWIKNISFEFQTKKNSEVPLKFLNAYIDVADVVPFSLLEVETTKNGNLKPQISEFKTKLYEEYMNIHSRDLKVCVSGLTTKRINIDEFLGKHWSDAYCYMIKFTDNSKAIKNLIKLDTHTEKN